MKRNDILCTAARLFAERGFANTPTILLAQEAGVAEGTIFRHFHTKDEIFHIIIENVTSQLIESMRSYQKKSADQRGMEQTLGLARTICVHVRKNRMEFGLVFRDAASRFSDENDPIFLSIRGMYDEIGRLLESAICAGQKDGSVGCALDAVDTAAVLVCVLTGMLRGLHFGLVERPDGGGSMLAHLLDDIFLMLSPAGSRELLALRERR